MLRERTEDYELLSNRLDASGAVETHRGEEPEEEFEAYFDPLNEVDLKSAIPQTLQDVTANANVLEAIMPELTTADKEALAAVSAFSS
ncbi:hypothetical protein KXD40_003635 [Peronospora effusa]|uniref:Uncharacterized protein n=1 Tax=Peronospora effusa TaxID=542832 RepID=A0A3M6VHT8_9STRA|nr:hypothetical protein DD238_003741 [Peronospora effusa]RQM15957.1 hypothetical protein DD237_004227 [Peronospora effusa]UIZ23071.1 hypothetical protein KXD40_003635 [Peronospora effusa]